VVAGRLEDVESLEGLPAPFTELACFAASQHAPWRVRLASASFFRRAATFQSLCRQSLLQSIPQPPHGSSRLAQQDDQRSLWNDALLPALVWDSVATLDLSGSPQITDASMRFLAGNVRLSLLSD
jgi:hypothetical protein